jgi:hypothetical protein
MAMRCPSCNQDTLAKSEFASSWLSDSFACTNTNCRYTVTKKNRLGETFEVVAGLGGAVEIIEFVVDKPKREPVESGSGVPKPTTDSPHPPAAPPVDQADRGMPPCPPPGHGPDWPVATHAPPTMTCPPEPYFSGPEVRDPIPPPGDDRATLQDGWGGDFESPNELYPPSGEFEGDSPWISRDEGASTWGSAASDEDWPGVADEPIPDASDPFSCDWSNQPPDATSVGLWDDRGADELPVLDPPIDPPGGDAIPGWF